MQEVVDGERERHHIIHDHRASVDGGRLAAAAAGE
jgi:hypothetical protein